MFATPRRASWCAAAYEVSGQDCTLLISAEAAPLLSLQGRLFAFDTDLFFHSSLKPSASSSPVISPLPFLGILKLLPVGEKKKKKMRQWHHE